MGMVETRKERSDRQLTELLNELRVALPGAQVLLAFLLAVPFATRFGRVDAVEKIALFMALISTVAGTLLLMAPPSTIGCAGAGEGRPTSSWSRAGCSSRHGVSWLSGCLAAVYLVTSVLYDSTVAIVTTCAIGVAVLLIWYLLPLRRAHGRTYARASDRRPWGLRTQRPTSAPALASSIARARSSESRSFARNASHVRFVTTRTTNGTTQTATR